nr:hypothetical protein Itr_chr13CG10660 [Ipomoea trifida]
MNWPNYECPAISPIANNPPHAELLSESHHHPITCRLVATKHTRQSPQASGACKLMAHLCRTKKSLKGY